jgi:uncharacterized delta-60 repeat protein
MKQILLSIGLAFSIVTANAQNGELDLNFNSTGIINNAVGSANSIAVDPSGNTVVIGHDRSSSTKHVYIYRYTSSGQLDNTFGVSGAVTFDLNTDYDYGRCIKALPNGKYLICGQNSVGPYFRGYVARLNANGTLDLSFGNSGKLIIDPIQTNLDVWSLDVANNGTIYAAGYITVSSVVRAAVWKISANGVLDQNFGTLGVANINSSNYGDRLYSIDFNDKNHLLAVAGVSTNVSTPEGLIALFDTAGQLQTNFHSMGYLTVAQSGNPSYYYDVCLRNTSVLACGFHLNNSNNNALVSAFELTGNPLTSFAIGGVYTDNLSTWTSFNQIDEDCNGDFYLGGHLLFNAMKTFYILKLSATGSIDQNFGLSGQFLTRLNPSYDEFIEGMALHGVNGIVACGRTYTGSSASRSGIVKVVVPTCMGSSINSSIAKADVFELYPNPMQANQVLTVFSSEAIQSLEMYNALGQLVYSQSDIVAGEKHSLNLPVLIAGIYHVNVLSRTRQVKTLVIQ